MFHQETKDWLAVCEEEFPSPFEAILDFDTIKKKYKKDEAYIQYLEDNE
jgi:hypothetical protein